MYRHPVRHPASAALPLLQLLETRQIFLDDSDAAPTQVGLTASVPHARRHPPLDTLTGAHTANAALALLPTTKTVRACLWVTWVAS